jgi:thiol:disulfide interchange protein
MTRTLASVVVCSLAIVSVWAPVAAHAAAGVSLTDVAASGGPLADQLKREAAAARKRGLQPVAELTADWCKPCRAIKRYLDDPMMVDAFKGVYLIRVTLDDWKQDELDAAGLRTPGVPTFFALDPSGRPTGRTITSSVWGDDIPVNMAPPLKRFFASLKK